MAVVSLGEFLVLVVGLGACCYGFVRLLGLELGAVASVAFIMAFFLTLHNVARLSAMSVEAVLTRIPVLGNIYEAWFKRDTYFRVDTRLMYLDLIPNLVRQLSESVTSAKGVRLVRQYELAPILGELYKPVVPRDPVK